MARVMISNTNNANDILFSGIVSVGSVITLERSDNACLPASLAVYVSDPQNTMVKQMSTTDSSCGLDRGLILPESYGALDFVGYSCNENDIHNCFLDVLYEFDACKVGDIDSTIFSTEFVLNGFVTDLLEGIPQKITWSSSQPSVWSFFKTGWWTDVLSENIAQNPQSMLPLLTMAPSATR
jgi:hypothetical protein